MRVVATKNVELLVFESVEEQLEETKETSSVNWSSWIGREFLSIEDVKQAARSNWQEGQELLQDMLEKLMGMEVPEPVDRRRKTTFNEYDGDELDFDRLRAGQDYWRVCKRQTNAGPQTVTLVVDLSGAAAQSWQSMLWRGAAAMALLIKLESHGYRVELWAVGGSGVLRDKAVAAATCLKRTNEPIDRSTMLNAISTWFFRTVIFGNWEVGAKGRRVMSGYGRPYTPTQRDLDEIIPDKERVYIAGTFSQQGALDVVRGELKKLAPK